MITTLNFISLVGGELLVRALGQETTIGGPYQQPNSLRPSKDYNCLKLAGVLARRKLNRTKRHRKYLEPRHCSIYGRITCFGGKMIRMISAYFLLIMITFNPNFCFTVPSSIENERLQLVPFDPERHSSSFVQSVAQYPELFSYLPFGPFPHRDIFDPWFEETVLKSQFNIAFAVFDKTRRQEHDYHNGTFAGMIGLLNASPKHLSTELGYIIIFPTFQRTHVSSNAVGLLLNWVLNSPADSVDPGLGLRRACWSANALNTRSIELAQRLGMKLEAIMRWDRVLPTHKSAFSKPEQLREGDPKRECPGRDTARLAICWDDWMSKGRNNAARVMNRVI